MFGHDQVFRYLVYSVIWFLNILSWAIVLNSLLSWILDPMHPVRAFLARFVEPIVSPFRALTSKLNTSGLPIDFSPLLAYFTLSIITTLLNSLLR